MFGLLHIRILGHWERHTYHRLEGRHLAAMTGGKEGKTKERLISQTSWQRGLAASLPCAMVSWSVFDFFVCAENWPCAVRPGEMR